MDNVLSVSELNKKIRMLLEHRFAYVWVKGEVTNCMRASSGHIYFSLKDGSDLLQCVWFTSKQKEQNFDPLTGEVWEDGPRPSFSEQIKDGQQLICSGSVGLYGARGQLQLVVEHVQEFGLGFLHQAFEKLKRKLHEEGLFDSSHKKHLPKNIRRVAVITARTGAVVHDFLRISQTRGRSAQIRIYPSLVQGEGASQMLCQTLDRVQKDDFAQVIVLIRGGGSLEDLWAFNDEDLARRIFACPIPIITGIGHEPDFSIADYVADISCATPSHVAQILWHARTDLIQDLDGWDFSLKEVIKKTLERISNQFNHQIRVLKLLSPQKKLQTRMEKLEDLTARIQRVEQQYIYNKTSNHAYLQEKLATCMGQFASVCSSQIENIENMRERFVRASGYNINTITSAQKHWQEKLRLCMEKKFLSHSSQLEKLDLHLQTQNPLAPLKKGYALVRQASKTLDGSEGSDRIVQSIGQIEVNENLFLDFQDGIAKVIVRQKIMPKDN